VTTVNDISVWEWFEGQAQRAPGKNFIFFEGDWLTYGEVKDRAETVARSMSALGVTKGDRVAFLAGNSPDYFIAFLAVARLGALFVPIIDGSTVPEIEYVLEHSDAEYLVTDKGLVASLGDRASALLVRVRRIFLLPGLDETPEMEIPDNATELLPISELGEIPLTEVQSEVHGDDDLGIFYTSGTTGKPKGVILQHRGWVAAGVLMSDRLQYDDGDVVLCALPLFHVGGLHYCMAPAIAARSGVMLQRKFSVTRFWKDVRGSGATAGLVMPAMMAMLLTLPESPDDQAHSLKLVVSHLREPRFAARFGVDIATTWAMSECSGIGTYTAPSYEDHEDKLVGWPLGDAELKIIDPSGTEVPTGAVGEVCVSHDWLMRGYLRDADNTALILRDGWLHSGDAGRVDENGRLFFEGRIKNMIKRTGENVAAEEVQIVLNTHPQVVESAVIGVPDPIRTEEVKAFVVRAFGSSLTPEELVQWCEVRLSNFKIPRYVQFVDKLPKSTTDKIQLFKLREFPNQTACWDRDRGS